MRPKLVSVIFVYLLFGVFFLPLETHAVSESAIILTATPPNPAPNEVVTISANSFATNLDAVKITWLVNGKKTSEGIGQKSVSFTASNAGVDTIVKATFSLPGETIEKQITVRPLVMVLLYEAVDAYVPPFYRGKALPTIGSDIKIIALPEIKSKGVLVNQKSVIYDWKRNYTNEPGSSGYGKNSFVFTNDYLEDRDVIEVSATTTDGQNSLRGTISATPSEPQISMYRYDQTLGVRWEEALKNGHRITGDEVIIAEPYFMSPKEILTPRLVWNWFMNNTLINTVSTYNKNVLPLRVTNGVSGVSNIRLEIENKDNLVETAEKELRVQF